MWLLTLNDYRYINIALLLTLSDYGNINIVWLITSCSLSISLNLSTKRLPIKLHRLLFLEICIRLASFNVLGVNNIFIMSSKLIQAICALQIYLKPIQNVDRCDRQDMCGLSNVSEIQKLTSVEHLISLGTLEFWHCEMIESIQWLGKLTKI